MPPVRVQDLDTGLGVNARDRERKLSASAAPAAARGLCQVGVYSVALQEGLHPADLVCRALEEGYGGFIHTSILPQICRAGQREGCPNWQASTSA